MLTGAVSRFDICRHKADPSVRRKNRNGLPGVEQTPP